MRYVTLAIVAGCLGCNGVTRVEVHYIPDGAAAVVIPATDAAAAKAFNAADCSDALARLAERCGTSATRRATMELDGTLTELVADGVPAEYAARVRAAVPAIGAKAARDLTAAEVATLRAVR